MNSFSAVVFLLLTVFPFYLSGNKVDSLSIVIEDTTEDSTLLRLYNELGYLQMDISYGGAESTIEKAIKLAKKQNDEIGLATAYYNKGRNLAVHNHFDKSKIYLQKSIDLFESQESSVAKLASAYITLGWVHDKQTNYYDALMYFKKANSVATELEYQKGMASSYINIGKTYNLLGNEDQAIDYYEKAGEIYKRENDKLGLLYYNNNIGYILYNKGDFSNALVYYNAANDLAIELELIRMESHITQNMILTLTELDRLKEATKLYQHAYKIDSDRADNYSLAWLVTVKAKIELKKNSGQYDIGSLAKAYKEGVSSKDLELQKTGAELLAKIYELKGDFWNQVKSLN